MLPAATRRSRRAPERWARRTHERCSSAGCAATSAKSASPRSQRSAASPRTTSGLSTASSRRSRPSSRLPSGSRRSSIVSRRDPDRRLAPLVGHPSEVVRFYVVRLLGRYPELARRHVAALTADPSPHVRAAALETLRAAGSADTLRRALEMLSDTQPFVRAQASRTAVAIAGVGAASFVAPLLADESWWVREAAREALVGAGPEVAARRRAARGDGDPALRKGAALVLQDVGALDALVDSGEAGELERIMEAGGGRLRRAAAERARRSSRAESGRGHDWSRCHDVRGSAPWPSSSRAPATSSCCTACTSR